MAAPIRYSPDLETVAPDEDETIRKLEEQFKLILDTTSHDYGHAVRGVHAKGHGLATGVLTVADGLPPELAQGLFAKPGRYDAVLRISTNPGDILDDAIALPRGLALKVLGVEGRAAAGVGGRDHAGLRAGQRPRLCGEGRQAVPRQPDDAGQNHRSRGRPQEGGV